MRRLLVIAVTTLLATNVFSAVECEKKGRFYYPKSEQAIQIAKRLGVKTCNGGRFKAVVKGLGTKSNVPATKQKMSVEDVIASMKK